jgi:hypothetical protein
MDHAGIGVSVVANIVPADVKAMTDLILEGDLVSARQWHRKLFALSKNMLTLATNPIPIKAAMAMLLAQVASLASSPIPLVGGAWKVWCASTGGSPPGLGSNTTTQGAARTGPPRPTAVPLALAGQWWLWPWEY